ncbi:hypothetical protein DPMN_181548 [Dreissena polymorpha]|uniref:Uncharacterized protein n=1 Tax=Dreissena polymorpha TaxID=45954 RepID=A0A9D4DDY8_DREPO|nr:hypothetical protein DPMN_181548 [Dreissena polymorpha]
MKEMGSIAGLLPRICRSNAYYIHINKWTSTALTTISHSALDVFPLPTETAVLRHVFLNRRC